jgi:hypothetical protein
MRSNILFYLLAPLTFLVGCSENPIERTKTNNPEINVSLLFEHDGVRVYRFEDGGKNVYYTDARGRTEWNTTKMVGKAVYAEYHTVDTVSN